MRCDKSTAGALLIVACVGCVAATPSGPLAATPSAVIGAASSVSAAGNAIDQPAIVQVAAYAPADGGGDDASTAAMSLEDLEAIALAHNPAIKELAATTQKAAGYRAQVTARPNPRVGYQGQQLADQGTDQHLAFVEQEFVTGDKLQLNHQVLNATVCAQLQELEAQRLRVTTDIRIRFYEALAIQRHLELIDDFSIVAEKGFELAEQRKKAGEGSQIDTLQASIQKSEVGLSRRQATARLAATWREIAALAGQPNMAQAPLAGTLPTETPSMEWNSLANTVIASSPEYAAARARVSRARAAVERQLAQQTPNLAVQMGAGVDNGTDSGMLNVQVGVPIPLYNKNRGNIAAARAEVCRAIFEAERIENSVRERLAVVSQDYEMAVAAIEQYATEILPSASSSMDLAEKAYQSGEADFVQILIARKTFYDSNVQYINAQAQLAIAQAKIEGVLLTGGLDAVRDDSGDDSLRGQAFSQQ
jgi:cobalt-zinc-cadmium efflux system outer membrane protein